MHYISFFVTPFCKNYLSLPQWLEKLIVFLFTNHRMEI